MDKFWSALVCLNQNISDSRKKHFFNKTIYKQVGSSPDYLDLPQRSDAL